MPEKTLSQKIDEAQSLVIMLQDSANAIYRSDMGKDISSIWFEGAVIILEQVENVMCDILDIGDSRLNTLQEDAKREVLNLRHDLLQAREKKDNPETEASEEPDLSGVDLDFEDLCEGEDCINVILEKRRANELKAVSEFLENMINQLDNHHTTVWSVHQDIIRQLAQQKKASEETQPQEEPQPEA